MTARKQPRTKSIIGVMFLYWISVIAWQTVRPVANRSLVDTAAKIALLLPVILYGFRHNRPSRSGGMLFFSFLFVISQLITLLFDSGDPGTGQLITVVFMMMQVFIFLFLLYYEGCTKRMIEKFCRSLVAVAAVMSLYNMVFNFTEFSHLFSGGGGNYGYECASFLYSNHEFGLYLSVAILSAFWLFFERRMRARSFLPTAALLLANLLSTYSRTAILGLVIAILMLTFFYNKKAFFFTLIIGGIALLIVSNVEFLDKLIFDSVLKGTFENEGVLDEERSLMYEIEMQAFREGSLAQKLFGQGHAGASQYGGHNAYLIILLTGGVVMFFFFLLIIAFGVYKAFLVLSRDKPLGALLLGYIVFALLYMMAQTPILFYSPMDSFFITMTAILFPLYISNGIKNKERFYEGSAN